LKKGDRGGFEFEFGYYHRLEFLSKLWFQDTSERRLYKKVGR
jgi:hypothetical protein